MRGSQDALRSEHRLAVASLAGKANTLVDKHLAEAESARCRVDVEKAEFRGVGLLGMLDMGEPRGNVWGWSGRQYDRYSVAFRACGGNRKLWKGVRE